MCRCSKKVYIASKKLKKDIADEQHSAATLPTKFKEMDLWNPCC